MIAGMAERSAAGSKLHRGERKEKQLNFPVVVERFCFVLVIFQGPVVLNISSVIGLK